MATAYTPDVYVRADGTATSVAAANDPSAASSAYSLATLEADKANTAGLVVAFSSQGGTFTTTDGTITGAVCCVDMQDGSTYTNVAGEDVVFDIQDDAAANPYVFAAETADTATLETNSTGSITLNGSGKGAVIRCITTAGAAGAGYGIQVIDIDVGRNHTAATTGCSDCYSTEGSSELSIIRGTVADIIAVGSLGTVAQVFTAHTTSKIKADGVTIQNVSEVAGSTSTAPVTLSNLTVTDWEIAICDILGSGTTTITDSTFVNDGSVRAASTGRTFSGANGSTGICNISNSSITVSAGGGTATLRDGTFNLTNVDYTITSPTICAVNVGLAPPDTGTITWTGGTITRGTAGGYSFYKQSGVMRLDRVKIVTDGVIATANARLIRTNQAGYAESWIRSSVIEWRTSSTGTLIWFSAASTAYDFDFSHNTVYGQGQLFETETGSSGFTFENNTFNGNGTNVSFAGMAVATGFDYNHFRDVTSKPTDSNEVGAGADPLFADPLNSNFTISSSSPLYRAGKDLAITTDFAGKTFNDATPSVGAHAVVVLTGFLYPRDAMPTDEARFHTYITNSGITETGDLQTDYRNAMAVSLGLTPSNNYSLNDLAKRLSEF